MKPGLMQSLCMVALVVGCGDPLAPDSQPIGEVPTEVGGVEDELSRYKDITHAKSVYGHVEEASSGQISFELVTVRTGRLVDVLGKPLQDLISVPDYQITLEEFGTQLKSVRLEARDQADDEWASPLSLTKFDELGRSTNAAAYALLAVRTTLDGQLREHTALQVCWPAQGYCLVMDPVVRNLEGFAGDRARLLFEGWKVEETYDQAEPTGEVGTQAVCTLNSRPAYSRRSSTWSGRTVTYKNVYGITVVQKTLGGQQVGISCYVSSGSCRASGFGYSYASSCWANVGFNCDCENTGNHTGSSSNAARAWSETKCGHKNVFQGSTNITWSKSGVGANFSISWGTSGASVDASGGTIYDSCSWH